MQLQSILQEFSAGKLSEQQAIDAIQQVTDGQPDYAQIDFNRLQRRGIPETVFCPGKTTGQIAGIMRSMNEHRQNVMATRATPEVAEQVISELPDSIYHAQARILTLDCTPLPQQGGNVTIISAGTADIPVAEEAKLTAERMGALVTSIYDIGVAGLHRLLNSIEKINQARVVVIVAGMEGALPSVAAGLINRPIIAVPTSIGYGLNMDGLTALLAMLNSCAAGVTTVNIDNGFGAGVAAALINRLPENEDSVQSA